MKDNPAKEVELAQRVAELDVHVLEGFHIQDHPPPRLSEWF